MVVVSKIDSFGPKLSLDVWLTATSINYNTTYSLRPWDETLAMTKTNRYVSIHMRTCVPTACVALLMVQRCAMYVCG